jgi:hypothetical protein
MEKHGPLSAQPRRENAWDVFERLSKLDRRGAIALGARRGPSDSVPFFRLGAAAHDEFLNWRGDLERRLRTGKMASEQPQEPTAVRYRTNDTSYEALAELIANNPTGMLVERDELVSLLRHLDCNDQAVARDFFLTGWSGTQPYTLDRISRGTRHIEAVCISVLGNSQPARIAEYVKRANSNAWR